MSLIGSLANFLSYLLHELPHPRNRLRSDFKIIIECSDEKLGYFVREAFLKELRNQLWSPNEKIDPEKPLTLTDMEVVGVSIEIRSRII